MDEAPAAGRADEAAAGGEGAAWIDRQRRFLSAADPDTVLLDDFRELIEAARQQTMARPASPRSRESGGPLRVLLLGYTGAGNTGADLRTIEVIRQMRSLFTRCPLELTVFALGGLLDHPDLRSVRVFAPRSDYLPDALAQAIHEYDVVLNVEGSTYTSKFSDSLAALLIGGAGLAAANGCFASAYGADAGSMSERLSRFAAATAEGVDIVCRSHGAGERLRALGLIVEQGTDAAWCFRADPGARVPLPPRYAVLCPNNPFWWPVETNVRRALELGMTGAHSPLRYGPLSFHSWDEGREARFEAYKCEFARIAQGLRERGYAPVFVAMEQLDRAACEEIAAVLPFNAPVLARGEYTLDAIVGTLEEAQWIVTTRYHASVMAIANQVPVVGVSMDSRIDQLFAENELSDWAISCEAAGFGKRVLERVDACVGVVLDALRARFAKVAEQESRKFALMGERLKRRVEAGFVRSR